MNSGRRWSTLILVAFGLAVLILDGGTAIEGARGGLEICLSTVLPSLFPFLFLSSILTSSLSVVNRRRHSALCRVYRIPQGAEGILLTGLLGGYPIGAKCIGEAVAQSRISDVEGERMLVFCNATGPAFLFGITGCIFPQRWVPWCLWAIHLLSGLCIARLYKPKNQTVIQEAPTVAQSIPQQLRQAIRVMSEICGWIILMRTMITVAQRWCFWYLPQPLLIFISGILEISNGCITLTEVGNIGLRFILCSVFINFGGLCVALQTSSVSTGVSQKKYLPGKLLQALIGFIAAYMVQHFVFQHEDQIHLPLLFHSALLIVSIIFVYSKVRVKKVVAIY